MKRLPLTLLILMQPAMAIDNAWLECRRIQDVATRVACYDNLVDLQIPEDSAKRPDPIPHIEANDIDKVPDAQSLFGKNDAEAKRIVETSLAIDPIVQIEADVVDVRKSALRKLTVVLDNGQTWRQLDNQSMPLKSGETVVIREASLGSFLMEKKSGSRSIRVKRAN
ncbi:MAG TPA: hypothetical protein PKH39_02230 [Woeseiaceae bacterium]|nr:hypothetical protein [Woeseiaceae bacterium]